MFVWILNFFFFGKHVKIALPIFWVWDRRYKEILVAENTNTEMKLLTQQQKTVMKNTIENRNRKAEERTLERTWEGRQEHAKPNRLFSNYSLNSQLTKSRSLLFCLQATGYEPLSIGKALVDYTYLIDEFASKTARRAIFQK